MALKSNIEWTNHTVNLWWGCAKVHEGCKNCYAEYQSETMKRHGGGVWGEGNPRRRVESCWRMLNKAQREAKFVGEMQRVFMHSMSDICELDKPLLNPTNHYNKISDLRKELWSRIVDGMYDNLIFLFLTKRPELIDDIVPVAVRRRFNVWFGTSISSQKTADYADRLGHADVLHRFLSVEPQVGEITQIDLNRIDWVIQGGESGSGKRPFDISWAYDMRDLCKRAGVPYFFKQIDKVQVIPDDLLIRELPTQFHDAPIT